MEHGRPSVIVQEHTSADAMQQVMRRRAGLGSTSGSMSCPPPPDCISIVAAMQVGVEAAPLEQLIAGQAGQVGVAEAAKHLQLSTERRLGADGPPTCGTRSSGGRGG